MIRGTPSSEPTRAVKLPRTHTDRSSDSTSMRYHSSGTSRPTTRPAVPWATVATTAYSVPGPARRLVHSGLVTARGCAVGAGAGVGFRRDVPRVGSGL